MVLILGSDSQIHFHMLAIHSSAAWLRDLKSVCVRASVHMYVCVLKAAPRSFSCLRRIALPFGEYQFPSQTRKEGTFQARIITMRHGKSRWAQVCGDQRWKQVQWVRYQKSRKARL